MNVDHSISLNESSFGKSFKSFPMALMMPAEFHLLKIIFLYGGFSIVGRNFTSIAGSSSTLSSCCMN